MGGARALRGLQGLKLGLKELKKVKILPIWPPTALECFKENNKQTMIYIELFPYCVQEGRNRDDYPPLIYIGMIIFRIG